MLSTTEENYLKAIYKIGFSSNIEGAGTNEIATKLNLKPATVTDMLKKLHEKDLVVYQKYENVKLTDKGKKIAIYILRKHRLWETFLCEKLNFSWDEVHDIAEQLEHIQSEKLIEQLDKYLNFPKFDPHGDSIPGKNGFINSLVKYNLEKLPISCSAKVYAVKDEHPETLRKAKEINIAIGSEIKVIKRDDYDGLTQIEISDKKKTISKKLAENILMCCNQCFPDKNCKSKGCVFK